MKKNLICIAILFSLMLFGCVTSFKTALNQSGINKLVGQTVYNRVNFRPIKENKIWYSNFYHKGILIPAGSICIISEITKSSITFVHFDSTSKNKVYELSDWLVDANEENIILSFHKFFVEDKDSVGLNNVRPEYYYGVVSGNEQLGMNKEEILLCLGYPAYIGRKDSTRDAGRDYILSQNDWYYLKSKYNKYLLTFKDEVLFKTYD